jgi:hypothetical protein
MDNKNVEIAFEKIRALTGVRVEMTGGDLYVDKKLVKLPKNSRDGRIDLTGERSELLGLQGIFPTTPRGDDRDKMLWQLIAAASPDSTAKLLADCELEREIQEKLQLAPDAAGAAAAALRERFFNSKKVPAMLPVHAALPLNYQHQRISKTTQKLESTGYRMFHPGILLYLLWDVEKNAVDLTLVEQLFKIFSNRDSLTALDIRFLNLALEGAQNKDAVPAVNSALFVDYIEQFRGEFISAGGPFCVPSLNQFRTDLQTVLDTELPRPERVQWLTLLLSLHLTVRMYRVAVVKGEELDLAVAAAGQIDPPQGANNCRCDSGAVENLLGCPVAGQLKFRTGSGRYRPVSNRDECRSSFVHLESRRLRDLPATLITRKLACTAWEALGGGEPAERLDLSALAASLEDSESLRAAHGAVCAAIAVLHHNQWRRGEASLEGLLRASKIGEMRPGLHALRDEVRLSRGRDLRHQSTDVVNQLMQSANVGPGSLLSRNGRNFDFFEVDEQLLLLLVRLICRDGQLPYDDFVQGLRAYGLAPQGDAEEASLADTLQRLGLLDRYSDSGEASFVHF